MLYSSDTKSSLYTTISKGHRISSIMHYLFPYSTLLETQFSFIKKVTSSYQPLLISAETGTGKTSALLVSFLLLKRPEDKIIIFVRTKAQIDVFLRELSLIYRRIIQYWDKLKPHFKDIPFTIALLGKNELCKRTDLNYPSSFYSHICSLTKCILYNNTMDLDNDSIKDIVEKIYHIYPNMINKEDIFSVYSDLSICPYYLNFALAQKADIIITSYPFLEDESLFNYLLQKLDTPIDHLLIAIDEAHNLFQLMNTQISKHSVLKASKEFDHSLLTSLRSLFINNTNPAIIKFDVDLSEFKDFETKLMQLINKQYNKNKKVNSINAYLTYNFIKRAANHNIIIEPNKLTIVNPLPSEILSRIHSSRKLVLMSGSFEPLKSFERLFEIPNVTKLRLLRSRKRINPYLILANVDFNGGYVNRDIHYFQRIGEAINQLAEVIPGHTIVFSPSYNYQKNLLNNSPFQPDVSDNSKMDINDIQSVIKSAKTKRIISGVIGGKLSEGIEFTNSGRSLIKGVIITALPFPPPDAKNELLLNKLSRRYDSNFASELLITIPTIQRLQQAFGRAVRNEGDIAINILLDQRGTSFQPIFKFKRFYTIDNMRYAVLQFFNSFSESNN